MGLYPGGPLRWHPDCWTYVIFIEVATTTCTHISYSTYSTVVALPKVPEKWYTTDRLTDWWCSDWYCEEFKKWKNKGRLGSHESPNIMCSDVCFVPIPGVRFLSGSQTGSLGSYGLGYGNWTTELPPLLGGCSIPASSDFKQIESLESYY